MPGLFGSPPTSINSPQAGFDPARLSGSDRLMLFGALLSDLGQGGGVQNLSAARGLIGSQALLQRQQAAQQNLATALAGTGGGIAPDGSATPYSPPSLRDPRVLGAVIGGAGVGLPGIEQTISALKGAEPDVQVANGVAYNPHDLSNVGKRIGVNLTNVNGTAVDLNDPKNAGKFYGDAPVKGAMPLYDQGGNIVDWKLPSGALASIGSAQRATSDAQNASEASYAGVKAERTAAGTGRGGAPYDLVTTQDADGHPVYSSRAAALGGGRGQSPAEAAAAGARASTTTQAALNLPQSASDTQTALNAIKTLRNSAALSSRTGKMGVLPAIPGTAGADFDAQLDQLKGKLFLTAYGTLKGGGNITEVEGKKATDAIGRLNRQQTPDGFRRALDDLAGVIEAGQRRAEAQAAKAPGNGSPPKAMAPPPMQSRQRGVVYQTPRGPMSWTGTGWVPAQ